MDAADPLCAISSAPALLPRTLGLARASATGPSLDALHQALAHGGSLTGSEELVKQATMALKENGDIQALYREDGAKAKAPANVSKEQHGRRTAQNRKRARFTMKDTASNPIPVVDQSKLTNISDPVEFFMTLERLEEAEEEIKRLNGGAEKRVLNFDPVDELKRQPGFRGRKSVRSFKVIEDAGTQDPIEVPASQTSTMTGSQFSQDVMRAVSDKNVQRVPSSSGEAVLEKEDSLAVKDGHDDLTYVLTSIQNLDESEEEEFFRKALGIKEIRKEGVSLRNSIPGVSMITEQKGPLRAHPPESAFCQPRQDRISELEKHLFSKVAENAKCTDDGPEGSPDIVMVEPSLVHDSSDVLMTGGNLTGSEIDRETPNLGARAADLRPLPEPHLLDHAYERQPGGSSVGLCRDTEVAKEDETCRRSNISVEFALQEDDVPIDYPTIGRSTNEAEASSHHLEGSSTEELVSNPGRLAAPDGTNRTSHAAEDSMQHLEVVKEGGVLQDTSSQSLEMHLEDIDPVSQPQMDVGRTEKLAPELCNALSLTKQKKQHAARKGKTKKHSKRGKKVADESSHALEIPQANFDLENQPHKDTSSQSLEMHLEDIDPVSQPQTHVGSTEKLATDLCNAQSSTRQKEQHAAKKGKMKKDSKRGKKVADESSHPLEIPQENFDLENQPHNDDVNIEQQTATSSTLPPNGPKGQKGAHKRINTEKLNQRKTLGDADLGVRRSSRTRSRCLDYWLGERLLYGPISDTLPAVIGVKAYSPGKDGKRTLKVKSFVPEQYSDLVIKSAKY